jgi:hypothetical protein
LKAFPVPVTDKCFLQLPPGTTGKISTAVYDMAGRKVREWEERVSTATPYIVWDLKGGRRTVSPGNYFITINANNKKFYKASVTVVTN